MRSAGMRGEPEYDVEKSGEAAAGDGSGIPACNVITARGEHQAGHRQGDDGVMPSPGGRRGLAASDLADTSQGR